MGLFDRAFERYIHEDTKGGKGSTPKAFSKTFTTLLQKQHQLSDGDKGGEAPRGKVIDVTESKQRRGLFRRFRRSKPAAAVT